MADFDKLDGRMQAKIAVRSSGASPRAIMANLNGTAFTVFQDGAIRGLNVAKDVDRPPQSLLLLPRNAAGNNPPPQKTPTLHPRAPRRTQQATPPKTS